MNVRNGGDTLCSASRWRNGNFLCRRSFLRENNQDEYSLAMLVSLFLCLRVDINYNDYATKSSQTDDFGKILPTWRLRCQETECPENSQTWCPNRVGSFV